MGLRYSSRPLETGPRQSPLQVPTDTKRRRAEKVRKKFYGGFVSRGISLLEGHGGAFAVGPEVFQQMTDKHLQSNEPWPPQTCSVDVSDDSVLSAP